MQYASSITRSGIQTFARYKSIKAGYSPPPTVTGGVLSADATYYYRTFIASGTLTISGGLITIDAVVVAGGGGGGGVAPTGGYHAGGGGGGAGGYLTVANYAAFGAYTIAVGAGGSTANYEPTIGGDTSAFTFTAIGGGKGATGGSSIAATNGGSGGGGGRDINTAGQGTASQGFAGAAGSVAVNSAAGGGGASTAGSAPQSTYGGNGGAGLQWLNGSYYAGGGAGGNGNTNSTTTVGQGGLGGGGNGSPFATSRIGISAGANTGGGGGGGGAYSTPEGVYGGSGGSGVVIVRYLKSAVVNSTIWRTDSASTSLKIATPLSADLSFNDYSATIAGSGVNRVMTSVNSPAFQTISSKYYGSSLSMGGYLENKYISTPTNANLQIGTNDFTIEGWYYFTSTSVSGGYQCMASHAGDSGDQQPGWVMILEANTTLAFYACTAGSTGWGIALTTSTTPTANTWHHVAVTRASGVVRMFLNGTQVGTVTSNNNIGIPASQTFRIGSYQYFPGPVAKGLSGYIQDFRFYVGAAKYTGAFTPPAQMYVG
jgi:hypothetical protein